MSAPSRSSLFRRSTCGERRSRARGRFGRIIELARRGEPRPGGLSQSVLRDAGSI